MDLLPSVFGLPGPARVAVCYAAPGLVATPHHERGAAGTYFRRSFVRRGMVLRSTSGALSPAFFTRSLTGTSANLPAAFGILEEQGVRDERLSPLAGRRIAGSIRLRWKQDIAGSNPAVLIDGPVVQREDAGLACR